MRKCAVTYYTRWECEILSLRGGGCWNCQVVQNGRENGRRGLVTLRLTPRHPCLGGSLSGRKIHNKILLVFGIIRVWVLITRCAKGNVLIYDKRRLLSPWQAVRGTNGDKRKRRIHSDRPYLSQTAVFLHDDNVET